MATITRGTLKGKEVELAQFCNDWATFLYNNRLEVLKITSFEFTDKEIEEIKEAERKGRCGVMFFYFEFRGKHLVKKKPRRK